MSSENKATNKDQRLPDNVGSPDRRKFIQRLARTTLVAPTAAVIFNSTTTSAAAS